MTNEQMQAVAKFYYEFGLEVAQTAPSLDKEFEQVQDYNKTILYGTLFATSLCFEEEQAKQLWDAAIVTLIKKLGYEPDFRPTVLKTGADTGAFKRWIYDERKWTPPTDEGK